MSIKNKITYLLLLSSSTFFAQEVTPVTQQATAVVVDTIVKKEVKISFLDSIKATFVRDEMATCVDSLWMKELTSLDLYDGMISDICQIDTDETVDFELPTELLKQRLKLMDEKSPFNIEYNIGLENTIKSFLKNRKKAYERLMGLSQFYFPVFEEQLAKNNIPLEIKYLAIVESALNPKAVSRVGATGLWQFMYHTGKQYGLKIDSYVDERSDPFKASEAASQYMTNMYKMFGDWDLVLASYNSGPGNVAKAIRRSGGKQNFWNIKKYLPRETQGYLPAFLATMYIFEYHKEHGIVPNKAIANHFATDTIAVKRHITFRQISDLLDISEAEIQFFNPSYKRNEIPNITGQVNFLKLPKDKIAVFASNEDKVYAYVDYVAKNRERPMEEVAFVKPKDSLGNELASRVKYHKIRRGENLTMISKKYNVNIDDLKKWNGLRSNSAPLGRNLKIYSFEKIETSESKEAIASNDSVVAKTKEPIAIAETKVAEVKTVEPKADKVFKTEKVVTYKDVTKFHKVVSGDNLTAIASKYDVSVADIKKWNGLSGNNIAKGKSLKIIKNEKVISTIKKEVKSPVETKEAYVVNEPKSVKTETVNSEENNLSKEEHEGYYVVIKGDNLSSIARKHNVTVQQLKEWNNLFDNNVKLGSQIIISNKSLVDSTSTVAAVETKTKEYTVQKGDNLGSIARKNNTTIENLREWNSIEGNNIKLGETLIVAKTEVAIADKNAKNKKDNAVAKNSEKANLYYVKRGDSLYSISQKFPGVSIADIKKWNNIKDESIKPGMKLKIGG
ncbi:MAG: LysM peptidoglycan-binding domain-containing protein [Flavobacterium sp.]|nr:LysM peptidoglycan-binding domain-containing protein [Flavobacterium sp.]